MADGYVELTKDSLQTVGGATELTRMLRFLYDNVAGDGETVRVYRGYGSPLNVVAAGIGSIYMRLDGGASTSIYIKESGTDGSGWVAK
jgi:hypothetical protein